MRKSRKFLQNYRFAEEGIVVSIFVSNMTDLKSAGLRHQCEVSCYPDHLCQDEERNKDKERMKITEGLAEVGAIKIEVIEVILLACQFVW
ncbi:MAG: hypothetical protein ACXVCD_15335 [Pseudobdellovibrionaceae bacterium]